MPQLRQADYCRAGVEVWLSSSIFGLVMCWQLPWSGQLGIVFLIGWAHLQDGQCNQQRTEIDLMCSDGVQDSMATHGWRAAGEAHVLQRARLPTSRQSAAGRRRLIIPSAII